MATIPTPRQLVTSLINALRPTQEPQPTSANPLSSAPDSKGLLLALHVLFANELLPTLDLLDRGLVTRLRLSPPETSDPTLPSVQSCDSAGLPSEGPQGRNPGEEGPQAPAFECLVGVDAAEHSMPSKPRPDSASRQPGKNSANNPSVYYVRSAQQQQQQQQSHRGASRYRNAGYDHTTFYEVRLQAWSCSCPAFAFSAFPAPTPDHTPPAPVLSTGIQTDDTTAPSTWLFGGCTLGANLPACKHLLACALVEHSSLFSHLVDERTVPAAEMAGWAAGWGD